MPESEKFLHEFGLIKGKKFGNYRLIHIEIIHKVIKIYKNYKYYIKLYFSNESSTQSIKKLEEELNASFEKI